MPNVNKVVLKTENDNLRFPVIIFREPYSHYSPPLVGGTEKILLVDDNPDIIAVAAEILKRFNYSVITADRGESALEIYAKNRQEVDLIILDIGMPGTGIDRMHSDNDDLKKTYEDLRKDYSDLMAKTGLCVTDKDTGK